MNERDEALKQMRSAWLAEVEMLNQLLLQAKKERDDARASLRGAVVACERFEKERDGLKGALDTTMIAATRRAAERDRLAAALERLVHTAEWLLEPLRKQDEHRSASHAEAYAALDAAREALAASQEQT